jgi:hypothetical protein
MTTNRKIVNILKKVRTENVDSTYAFAWCSLRSECMDLVYGMVVRRAMLFRTGSSLPRVLNARSTTIHQDSSNSEGGCAFRRGESEGFK